MLVKMTAMGVVGKKAYLAETWNRLDMFIVIAGSVAFLSLICRLVARKGHGGNCPQTVFLSKQIYLTNFC